MKFIKYLAAMATALGVTGVSIGGTISYMPDRYLTNLNY